MQLFLFLLVGRLERQDKDTTSLIPATDEAAAHDAFYRVLADGDADEDRELDMDVSVLVGEYTGVNTVRVPDGTDWHLSTVYPLGLGLPEYKQVEVRPDGEANVYTLHSGKQWIASVRMNGEYTGAAQEAYLRSMADAIEVKDE